MGNYDKAKKLLKTALKSIKKVSLEDRPWTARTLAWLGCVYRGLGDYDQAKQSLEKVLKSTKRIFMKITLCLLAL